jgi:hypothetical protein
MNMNRKDCNEGDAPEMKPPRWIGKDGRHVYRRIATALLPLGGLDPRLHAAFLEVFSVTTAQTLSAARELIHNEEAAVTVRNVLRSLIREQVRFGGARKYE